MLAYARSPPSRPAEMSQSQKIKNPVIDRVKSENINHDDQREMHHVLALKQKQQQELGK
jgi:hypothetical protein